ncbi:bacterial regulatory helix-turn-helix, lysR family protein [Clostridium argentinense CDC 2741]|uniref:Bacterial regulatory helix-turn-helix, lysR family protein n=1 Tax=Clostridium argentinense CDC 2741 TaxID=1418104 RepID=A0A0C1QW80_9CLOT|nr:LysR family transcriptional regulator [Clostridium argentinense]ARC84234.1 LysR family transcriptional regulator [Clostridium argentinense]KIE45257.1 bacterial regulatory helix-turn-helix, lysR family protein [Clostridium argentinense CDC 2741]NFF38190.1 LysR family transcriptional regulator [Clostridium argentinense]NFP49224.1 LysR family transcriptional regulator [Clostridium argentinense]NFP71496.1 LysR family transcriptional regulator [Clostridium argentinense]
MINKLDLYKIFCQVAECESFSKASKILYMTQPAVSQAIMQLEKELDIRLFTRTPKGVNLTKEGQLLYEYTSSAINLISVGEKKLEEVKNLMVGDLQIGVGDTISRYFLLPFLEKFHSKYPNIKLKIINRTTLELCEMLKSGEIDIALGNLPIKDSSLEIRKCIDIRDVFVCGEKYKEKLSEPISLEELAELPLILLETNSNSRLYVEKYMLSKGIEMKPEIELGSHELLLEFAKINLGISCVIKEFSQEYLKNGLLYEVKLTEEIPKRSIGICFLKNISLSPSSTKFVEILESE